jgi:sugar O-acyltransferase (sialic acid O-acetyltransferase NeuD family)
MILFGASGHAKVIFDCLKASGMEVTCVFDDDPTVVKLNNLKVSGSYDPQMLKDQKLIVAVGENLTRKRLAEKIRHQFGMAIHPSAIISPYSKIGEGTVVLPGSIVNSGSVTGMHCVINTAAIVEHDSYIFNFVHLAPNVTLCGGVEIGEGTFIGAASTVLPNVKIGKWCVIGAGSLITQNIPDYSLVMGVPGKVIRTLSKTV